LAFCVPAVAQQPKKISRIGYLSAIAGDLKKPGPLGDAFRQGLLELGYVEGKNIAIEYRYAEGKIERLSDLASDLVNLWVDVIFATSTPATFAARSATKTIPIVFTNIGDPVGVGLVTSLARAGTSRAWLLSPLNLAEKD
jgi:putative ABC transport system substrate-binding protein